MTHSWITASRIKGGRCRLASLGPPRQVSVFAWHVRAIRREFGQLLIEKGANARSAVRLTMKYVVGILANIAAQLITRFKNVNPDGSILELVVWKLPTPVPPTDHGYKYRAVYMLDGQRIVGFDNERGKGDHCHLDGKELPYTFISVNQLVEDFITAVTARRTS